MGVKTSKSTQTLKSTKTGSKTDTPKPAIKRTKQRALKLEIAELKLEVAELKSKLAVLETTVNRLLLNPPAQAPVYVPMPYPVPYVKPEQPWWVQPFQPFVPQYPCIPYSPYIQPVYPLRHYPIWMVELPNYFQTTYDNTYQVPYTEYPNVYCGGSLVSTSIAQATVVDSQLPLSIHNNTTGCKADPFATALPGGQSSIVGSQLTLGTQNTSFNPTSSSVYTRESVEKYGASIGFNGSLFSSTLS